MFRVLISVEPGRHRSEAAFEFMNPLYVRGPLRKSIRHVDMFLEDITDDDFDLLSVYGLKRLLQHLTQQCAGIAVSPDGIRVAPTVIEKDSVLSFVESFS